ncbi:hypothetical protein WR25_25905 [Diploscapter pachys]|uniref:Neurotransmitter-gated ion-channel ligand-binding domain-containing protein n=1 Tax=Diploscapter pachys TaxID=2018661 RepID=A0A2A2J229_9BILA|nr:hypothetical protein WR25_25905 [Diploscapter pachys]
MLVVKMKMFLQQVLDVDEREQLVSINAWLSYVDVLLYNSASEDFDSTFKSNLVVYNTGDVIWIPPGVLKFVCKLDVTCGFALDLQIDSPDTNSSHSMDLSTFIVNGEWVVVDSPAVRHVNYFKCCPEPYPTIKYYLHLRRRTLFYGFNLIIPSFLICLMTMLGFILPPDSGEKINLQVSILLAIVFFLSMISEMTPPTSEAVPLIGVFFSCCMLVISTSVVFTVLSLNIYYRSPDTHIMRPLVRQILLEWLPWILCMSRKNHRFNKGKSKENPKEKILNEEKPILRKTLPSHHPVYEAQILMLHAVHLELKQMVKFFLKEERDEKMQMDWRFASTCVDRCCLYMFSFFVGVSTISIIMSAPHLIA